MELIREGLWKVEVYQDFELVFSSSVYLYVDGFPYHYRN